MADTTPTMQVHVPTSLASLLLHGQHDADDAGPCAHIVNSNGQHDGKESTSTRTMVMVVGARTSAWASMPRRSLTVSMLARTIARMCARMCARATEMARMTVTPQAELSEPGSSRSISWRVESRELT